MILWWRALHRQREAISSIELPLCEVPRRAPGRAPAGTERGAAETGLRGAARVLPALLREAKKRLVAMPSQVVDDAWHEFILFSQSMLGIAGGFTYQLDCLAAAQAGAGSAYCAGHIGCGGGCSGSSGDGDSSSGDGCGGGGCGGD
jgi:hypothetical protein